MTTENKSWTGVQAILGSAFQLGDNCLYKETEDGHRIEVTGTCSDSYKRHFNIYLLQDGAIVGQATGVPQDKLNSEIETLCKFSSVK